MYVFNQVLVLVLSRCQIPVKPNQSARIFRFSTQKRHLHSGAGRLYLLNRLYKETIQPGTN